MNFKEMDQNWNNPSAIFYRNLILALASNPNMVITFQGNDDRFYPDTKETTFSIFKTANAIINEMEKD